MTGGAATWETRLLATEDEPARAIEALFEQQVESWPLLRAGIEGLEKTESRILEVDGFPFVASHIPHRIHSTTAQVDDRSIRERACFLCVGNLPAEERAVALGSRFVITCNPYPILARHVSVVAREHRPQRAEGDIRTMLDLARALPEYLVLYNGGQCGASAPDHMHFQACRRETVPLMEFMTESLTKSLTNTSGSVIEGYPATHLWLRDNDPSALEARFGSLMERLAVVVPSTPEPMVNLIAVYGDETWSLAVFPRLRHRSAAYSSGELIWSPGALDLAGILVLPRREDLAKITPDAVRRGFAEVCLPAARIPELAGEMELP